MTLFSDISNLELLSSCTHHGIDINNVALLVLLSYSQKYQPTDHEVVCLQSQSLS